MIVWVPDGSKEIKFVGLENFVAVGGVLTHSEVQEVGIYVLAERDFWSVSHIDGDSEKPFKEVQANEYQQIIDAVRLRQQSESGGVLSRKMSNIVTGHQGRGNSRGAGLLGNESTMRHIDDDGTLWRAFNRFRCRVLGDRVVKGSSWGGRLWQGCSHTWAVVALGHHGAGPHMGPGCMALSLIGGGYWGGTLTAVTHQMIARCLVCQSPVPQRGVAHPNRVGPTGAVGGTLFIDWAQGSPLGGGVGVLFAASGGTSGRPHPPAASGVAARGSAIFCVHILSGERHIRTRPGNGGGFTGEFVQLLTKPVGAGHGVK
jgi:hypothetical protein